MSGDTGKLHPHISLPGDDELPPEIQQTLAALPPLNVFRIMGRAPASFQPFLELALSQHAEPHPREHARSPRRNTGALASIDLASSMAIAKVDDLACSRPRGVHSANSPASRRDPRKPLTRWGVIAHGAMGIALRIPALIPTGWATSSR